MQTPKFVNKQQSNFYQELKDRVNEYFNSKHIEKTGNARLYTKAIILVTIYLATLTHLLFFTPSNLWALLECVLLGATTSAIGFNVMHDGAHGSFSKSEMLNEMAAFSANMLGASSIMWKNKHNIVHHTYTNIDGVDDDIEIKPMLRLCSSQQRKWIHQFQHIYVWFLYAMLLIVWLFFKDYKKYFTKKIGIIPLKKMSTGDHIKFWSAKIGYAALMIAFPIYKFGFLAWLAGYLVMAVSTGLILSTVFQLAHTVEETSFPLPNDEHQIENEWAIHQLATTANFATENKLISWYVGGLNFQVEHHLFPKISHIHYPALSKIIKETCQDFNIKYIEYKRMTEAMASHARHLRQMGVA